MKRERAYELRDIISHAMQSVDDKTAFSNPNFYPEWEIDVNYVYGMKVRYNGKLYKVLKSHISQEFYSPEDAPDLFGAPEGLQE